MTALPHKESVRVIALTNLTLSGAQTIDGVAVVAGDRVLAAGQTTASANGIYRVATGAWTRAYDASSSGIMFPGHVVPVSEGTLNAQTKWACSNTGTITLGTTALTYTRIWPAYDDYRLNPWNAGVLGDTIQRETATSTLQQVSGTVYLHGGIVLNAGIRYTNINVYFTTSGTLMTHLWAGLAAQVAVGPYSARQLMAVSGDLTAGPTANAVHTFALSSAFTPTVDVPAWMVLCFVATTTIAPILASPAVTNTGGLGIAPIMVGTSNTAQTTPIAVNTVLNAPTVTSQVGFGYLN